MECPKTKTKVITLANHKGHGQSSEPVKTGSNYMYVAQSAGKRVRVSQKSGFVFTSDWMKSGVNFLSQLCSLVDAEPITF